MRAVVGVRRLGTPCLHADQAEHRRTRLPEHFVCGTLDAAQILPGLDSQVSSRAHHDLAEVVSSRADRRRSHDAPSSMSYKKT
ncbi:unannotated protein [freshwater metagenome]|uniref:Unannotated protein n=1 Tax=freshwater metagenome TaxID=449393 RepID=A0A6J7C1J2_9ZZZZ